MFYKTNWKYLINALILFAVAIFMFSYNSENLALNYFFVLAELVWFGLFVYHKFLKQKQV
ncbi:hypothetical protein [Mesonia sp. K7]|uniref:hypothetical protein n=1 Tax=Mesonia sp. K7 TaxID=2218606 RepID=UPI0011B5AA56|nr:hypothetical protein [Mesonia sp. K7]